MPGQVLPREPGEEVLMDVGHHLRRPDLLPAPFVAAFLQLLFGRHVRDGQPLAPGLVFVLGVVVAQGALDIQRQRVLPLDFVRVVRVHRAQQTAQPRQCARLVPPHQPIRLANQVVGALQQRPQAMLGRQQGLHLRWMVTQRKFLRHGKPR